MSKPYENEKGVNIRVRTDKRDIDHIDIYDKDPREEDHKSIHINLDTNTGKGTIVDTTSGEKEKTDVNCFLTTACMKYYLNNFDDNCKKLTILRWFRDNFVLKEDIKHYYEIAPMIVDEIEQKENNDEIYNYIYTNVVVACVEAIKKGDYAFAYNRYKNSVLALEEEYVRPRLEQRLVKALKINCKTL